MKMQIHRIRFSRCFFCLGLAVLASLCATALASAQDLPPYAGDIPLDLKDVSDYEAVIYIDPDALSSGDGSSPASPLRSWTEVSFEPDTAYVQKRGTTDYITTTIGVDQDGVLLGAYGDAATRSIIYADVDTSASNKYVLGIGSDSVTVRDLEVVSPQATSAIIFAHWIEDPVGGVVWNCSFHGVDQDNYLGWGVRIFGPETKILNSEIYFTGDDGIFIKNSPMVEIGYNTITRVNQKWFEDPGESYSGGDSVQYDGDINGFYIHHNLADRSDTGNKFCFIANPNVVGVFGLIENNECIVAKGRVPVYANQYDGEVRDYRLMVRNNLFRYVDDDNDGIGIYSHAAYLEAYNNVFVGFREGIALLTPASTLAKIHHNVFYGLTESGVWGSSPKLLYNNIFALEDGLTAVSSSSNLTASHNLFALASQVVGDNALVGDPLFVDPAQEDFRLRAGSPAIDAGTSLAGVATDAAGYVRDARPDLGAYEFQADLDLSAALARDGVQLTWTVNVTLPVTSTWRISYVAAESTLVLVATETLSNPERSYLLTGLEPGVWYTVTLDAMLDDAVLLSDSERVMYTDVRVYLPLLLKS